MKYLVSIIAHLLIAASAYAQQYTATALPPQREEDIASAIAQLGDSSKSPWQFARIVGNRTVEFNEQPLIDPEGEIQDFSYWSGTGYVTYAIRNGDGTSTVKLALPGGIQEPVRIAKTNCRYGNVNCVVETSSGKRLSGDQLYLLSRGVMVARANVVFLYEPGKGVRTLNLPRNTELLLEQPGEILATRALLIRDFSNDEGGFLGMGVKQGFALINIDSGKKVAQFRGRIPAKSGWFNVDSERDKDVRRSIAWFNTKSGAILVSLDNGLKDLVFTNLDSGQKVVAYTRDAGIAGFEAEQNQHGRIMVRNSSVLGIGAFDIADVEAFMASPKKLGAE